MNYDNCLSASDVALLSGSNNNGGFGDSYGAWIIIFLIFAFGGFGRNGFGNSNGGVSDNYVLASDFSQLSRQLDSGLDRIGNRIENVNNGLCSGFYQELVNTNGINSNISNSTAQLQSTLCQGFNGVNTSIMGVGNEVENCCCRLQSDLANINYNMAMNTNNIQQTLCNNTRDIIENQNCNYRNLHDEIVANRIEDKNSQIQAQQNEINALRLSASQQQQNAYLLDQLRNGCPVNAQIVSGNIPVPVQYIGAGCNCNGYNNFI